MSADSQSDKLVREKVEQWDNNKEQIARLSTMEEDLSLLIQALSAQTDIDAIPEPLKRCLPSKLQPLPTKTDLAKV